MLGLGVWDYLKSKSAEAVQDVIKGSGFWVKGRTKLKQALEKDPKTYQPTKPKPNKTPKSLDPKPKPLD